MKVLLVSLSNVGGGAARALDSLAILLQKKGVSVDVLVYEGVISAYNTWIINHSLIEKLKFRLKNKIIQLILRLFKNPSLDYRSVNFFDSHLVDIINNSDADIINFHWIGAEMLSIEQMSKIQKPVVWYLHDAWLLNGIYHVSPEDYQPFLDKAYRNILDKWCLRRKCQIFSKQSMHYMAPSYWLKDKYDHSGLKKSGDTFTVVRNIINTEIWTPINKTQARSLLGFDRDRVHVLFIAQNSTKNFNKGFIFIRQLLDLCDDRFLFHFVGTNENISHKNVQVHSIVSDQNILVNFYSASDICIVPSFSESMSYTALESIFCNTPVLCFDTSGIAEIVSTGVNGYKAKKFDVHDLLAGLNFLADKSLGDNLKDTLSEYDPELNISRFINEYRNVISKWQKQNFKN